MMSLSLPRLLACCWMPGRRDGGARAAWEHPGDVAAVLAERPGHSMATVGYRSHLEAVAWLHDVLEDGILPSGARVSASDLAAEGVDPLVVRDVVMLSRMPGVSREEYFARVKKGASDEALFVKCADRVANLREAKGAFSKARAKRYCEETEAWVVPLAKMLPSDSAWFVKELTSAVAALRKAKGLS